MFALSLKIKDRFKIRTMPELTFMRVGIDSDSIEDIYDGRTTDCDKNGVFERSASILAVCFENGEVCAIHGDYEIVLVSEVPVESGDKFDEVV